MAARRPPGRCARKENPRHCGRPGCSNCHSQNARWRETPLHCANADLQALGSLRLDVMAMLVDELAIVRMAMLEVLEIVQRLLTIEHPDVARLRWRETADCPREMHEVRLDG